MRKILKDVSKKAGVSIALASRAMGSYGYVSKETREKVLKVAKKIGYQPDIIARSLMTRKTHTMGIIISDITTLFFTSAVRGIEDVAGGSGYNVLWCNSDENLLVVSINWSGRPDSNRWPLAPHASALNQTALRPVQNI